MTDVQIACAVVGYAIRRTACGFGGGVIGGVVVTRTGKICPNCAWWSRTWAAEAADDLKAARRRL